MVSLGRNDLSGGRIMYQRIMVCYDGSATAKHAIEQAQAMAVGAVHSEIHILHVINERPSDTIEPSVLSGETRLMRDAGARLLMSARSLLARFDGKISTQLDVVLGANLCDVICEHPVMWGADVIVIGTHGRRGARHDYLGSDAEQVLNRSSVPVLLVRPQTIDESGYDSSLPTLRRLAA
ncbi:universal stress protein [soil metagenome]